GISTLNKPSTSLYIVKKYALEMPKCESFWWKGPWPNCLRHQRPSTDDTIRNFWFSPCYKQIWHYILLETGGRGVYKCVPLLVT
ncbi:hypothetical protein CHS0354_034672, partial [Potamilus streckersoni]